MKPPRLRPILTVVPRKQLIAHPRCFRPFSVSTPRHENIELAYDLWEPPTKTDSSISPEGANAPIIFMHGLFGNKKNNRSMSKVLAKELNRPVYAVDLRNHGSSPHTPVHNYNVLASDVLNFMDEHNLQNPTLIGHSMGAKTAMCVALSAPSRISSLVAVDNAPVDAALKTDFGTFVRGMKEVERANVSKLSEADEILKPYSKDLAIRQFLLTNLIRSPDSSTSNPKYIWRIPLRHLTDSLDLMGAFPYEDPEKARYEGPTLFVRGTKSHYVPDETLPIIGRFFPRFELADVEAGHWVISENPREFSRVVTEFLRVKE